MIYYTADLHLGHGNIIHHCNRPFANVEEMNETIIKNWCGTVSAEDDIYVLGDFIFKDKNPIQLLERLTGRIHLIKGNHDTLKSKWCERFESVDDLLEIDDEGRRVVLCHYPLAEWDGFFRGAYHLYGHIHNNDCETRRIMAKIPNCYNVGVDCLNFLPMTLTQIIDFYAKRKA